MTATFDQLVTVRSRFVEELLAYLEVLRTEANQMPPYYPPGARLNRLRVRVRVSSERQKFDPAWAAEQKRARRMGLADDETLSRAYAHRLSRDGAREGAQDERGQRSEVKILDWDKEVRDRVQRGIIVGDPGLGKTWLLKWEASCHAEAAVQHLNDFRYMSELVIPVYCRLTDVAAELAGGAKDLPAAIMARLRAFRLPATDTAPSRPLTEPLLDFIAECLGTKQRILLLDALDEVPAEHRDTLLAALSDWVSQNSVSRVFLSSRLHGYTPPWRLPDNSETEREMELMPFDNGQISEFADAFFAGEQDAARELRDIIRRAPQLRGMAQIPLLLGFLCVLHHDECRKPQGQRRDLAQLRRGELYDTCLRKLLSGVWRDGPPRSDEDVDDDLELLEPLALALFAAGKEQFSRRDLRQTVREGYRILYPHHDLSREGVTRLIDKWSKTDGLLVSAGAGDNPPYLFLHLTFQEYLAAGALAEDAAKHGWSAIAELVNKKSWDPRWQEVITLLAGKLNDPMPLLELLADKSKDDYFRHRLAVAAHCLPEIRHMDTWCLHQLRDPLTTDVVEFWYQDATKSNFAVPHLKRALPVLAQLGGRVRGATIADWLARHLHDDNGLGPYDGGSLGPYIAADALQGLAGRIRGDTALLSALFEVVVHGQWEASEMAAAALGKFGEAGDHHPDVLPTLLANLHHEDMMVWSRATTALAKMAGAIAHHPDASRFMESLVNTCFSIRDDNLSSKHSKIAEILANTVQAAAPQPAVPVLLVQMLQIDDSNARHRAVRMLAEMGEAAAHHSGILPRLAHILGNDENDWVRIDVVRALEKMRGAAASHRDVLPALMNAMRYDANHTVRYTAAEVLGAIGKVLSRDATTVRSTMLKSLTEAALSDEDSSVRYHAAQSLGQFGEAVLQHPDALLLIVNTLRSSADNQARTHAALALMGIGQALVGASHRDQLRGRTDSDVVDPMKKPVFVQIGGALSETLRRDKDDEVRFLAVRTFFQMGQASLCHEDVMPALVEAIRDDDNLRVRHEAVQTMGRVGALAAAYPETPLLLMEILHHTSDNEMRYYAVDALGNMGSAAASCTEVPVLLVNYSLYEEDRKVRHEARMALHKMQEPVARHPAILPLLLGILCNEEEDINLRRRALHTMSWIGEAATCNLEVLPALLVASCANDARLRSSALYTLGNMGETATSYPQVFPTLIQVAHHDADSSARQAAIEALLALNVPLTRHYPETLLNLVAVLEEEQPWRRVSAIQQFGHLGEATACHPAAVTALIEAARHDSDREVRKGATQVLGGIAKVLDDYPNIMALFAEVGIKDEAWEVRRTAADVVRRFMAEGGRLFVVCSNWQVCFYNELSSGPN